MDLSDVQKLVSSPKAQKVVKSLVGQLGQGQQSPQPQALAAGLQGMVTKGGMDNQLKSWLSSGNNEQISGQQIKAALGQETISKISNTAGCSEQETLETISGTLPGIVDVASPNGQLDPQALQSTLDQLAGAR